MLSERKASILIVFISILIPVIVTILFFLAPPEFESSIDLKFFPKFHAILNSLTAIAILCGFYFIKNKKIKQHRISMLFAFLLSAIFLCSYVWYHSLSEPTSYGGGGLLKMIYYFILLTHIILAAAILPLILFTFYKALTNKIETHKKLAKWTFPLWLYVAISGVLVYLLISPYYG